MARAAWSTTPCCRGRLPATSAVSCCSPLTRRPPCFCSQPRAESSSAAAASWSRADRGVSRQRLGQHFLVKGSVLERIAAAACPQREPLVIEIGPGKGALTERLLARADRVVAIELDEYLAGHLRARFPQRLEVIQADVLETDLNQWGPSVVAGNLPYYISTAILSRVLTPGSLLTRGVFLVQKEVADRVTATPGSRAYGYLSVEMQLYATVRMLFEVRPGAFYPPPKVDSALIGFDVHSRAAELGIPERAEFLKFV